MTYPQPALAPLALIAAVARNGVIGKDGTLPWQVSEDLKHFKKTTSGHVIIMGRKTHDSIGRPLPKRRNIVVTRRPGALFPGCETAHSLDEAIGLPSDHAAKIAVRTQQIVLEESGTADVIDPLGGSYLVESLTNDIESRAAELIEAIDGMGGMVKAIEASYPQREIEKSSYEYQKAIERGDQKVIGVNAYRDEHEAVTEALRLDPSIETSQVEELKRRKSKRDAAAVKAALDKLDKTAATDTNLFPPILEAVRHSVTIGEICSTLAGHFGRYRERTNVR